MRMLCACLKESRKVFGSITESNMLTALVAILEQRVTHGEDEVVGAPSPDIAHDSC